MNPNIMLSTGGGNAANYLAAVEAAGGVGKARYLPAPDLSCDGLVLVGGDDMDPALFGQKNTHSRGIDRARDDAELALLDAFCGARKPVLAICRGHQVVNVWLGGGLIQDLPPEQKRFHARTWARSWSPSTKRRRAIRFIWCARRRGRCSAACTARCSR